MNRADGAAIVDAVAALLPDECLQAAGAALLISLTAEIDGAAALSLTCTDRLGNRDWDGDAELVTELDVALGRGAASSLRPLPVDLEALADVLSEGLGEEPGLLDLVTGDVWPAVALDYARETDDEAAPTEADGVNAIDVFPDGSDESYRDMRDFIVTVADRSCAERLSRAVEGKGAFRRFRDVIDAWPDETTRWHAFSDDRRIGRARSWLADAGYRPVQRSAQPDREDTSS